MAFQIKECFSVVRLPRLAGLIMVLAALQASRVMSFAVVLLWTSTFLFVAYRQKRNCVFVTERMVGLCLLAGSVLLLWEMDFSVRFVAHLSAIILAGVLYECRSNRFWTYAACVLHGLQVYSLLSAVGGYVSLLVILPAFGATVCDLFYDLSHAQEDRDAGVRTMASLDENNQLAAGWNKRIERLFTYGLTGEYFLIGGLERVNRLLDAPDPLIVYYWLTFALAVAVQYLGYHIEHRFGSMSLGFLRRRALS